MYPPLLLANPINVSPRLVATGGRCLWLAGQSIRRAKISLIFAAANVSTEAIVIGHPDSGFWRRARREGDAPKLRINSYLVALGPICPVAQICHDNLGEQYGNRLSLIRLCRSQRIVAPDAETLSLAVVVGGTFFERSPADRCRHIHLVGDVGWIWFFDRFCIELRVVAQHAERVMMTHAIETKAGARVMEYALRRQMKRPVLMIPGRPIA